MGRGRGKAVLVEHSPDLLRGAAEVSGKFNFLVTNLSDLGDGAFEVILHEIAHAVELHSDLVDFVLAGGPSKTAGEQGSRSNCGGGFQKTATVHYTKIHDGVSSEWSVTDELKSGSIILVGELSA